MNAGTFGAVGFALLVAHEVGDYWLQTDHQANHKNGPGLRGWLVCARHVASYTAATATLVALVWLVFDLPITPTGFVLGQLASAATHLVIDRRHTLRAFAHHVTPWNRTYYDVVPGGAERLDQSAHMLWLLVAALLTAVA